MTGYTLEQQARLDELAARKRGIDERAGTLRMQVEREMRGAGIPIRGDYANRAAYRGAYARWRTRKPDVVPVEYVKG